MEFVASSAQRVASVLSTLQEGVWLWVANGQKLRTTQFWRPGAPDNANDGEHCAQMSNEIDFGWDDVPCSTEGRYFCQLPHPN